MDGHENGRVQNQHKLALRIANLQATVKKQEAEIQTQKEKYRDLSDRMAEISQMYQNQIAELQARIHDLQNKKNESDDEEWEPEEFASDASDDEEVDPEKPLSHIFNGVDARYAVFLH